MIDILLSTRPYILLGLGLVLFYRGFCKLIEFAAGPPPIPPMAPPIMRPMSTRCRIAQAGDLSERRAAWGARMEIERMCHDVSVGRKP